MSRTAGEMKDALRRIGETVRVGDLVDIRRARIDVNRLIDDREALLADLQHILRVLASVEMLPERSRRIVIPWLGARQAKLKG